MATVFVNAETALKVVETFVKYEGKMTEGIEWILHNREELPDEEDDWDEDDDDDDDFF